MKIRVIFKGKKPIYVILGNEDEKNGVFFVNLVLECLVNWADWYQGEFRSYYEDLKKQGVIFPLVWNHFLDFAFISKNTYVFLLNPYFRAEICPDH